MVFPDESEPNNIGQEIRSRVILGQQQFTHATSTPQGGLISERRLLSARRLLVEQGTVLSSQVNNLINDGMDQYKKTIPQGEK